MNHTIADWRLRILDFVYSAILTQKNLKSLCLSIADWRLQISDFNESAI